MPAPLLQTIITFDPATGSLNVSTPDGVPPFLIVGWLETAKFWLLNQSVSKPQAGSSILPADASVLKNLDKGLNGSKGL